MPDLAGFGPHGAPMGAQGALGALLGAALQGSLHWSLRMVIYFSTPGICSAKVVVTARPVAVPSCLRWHHVHQGEKHSCFAFLALFGKKPKVF